MKHYFAETNSAKKKRTISLIVIVLTQFRVWVRPDAISSAQYALEKGADIIDFYGEYFGTKFPLPKMGKVLQHSFGFNSPVLIPKRNHPR